MDTISEKQDLELQMPIGGDRQELKTEEERRGNLIVSTSVTNTEYARVQATLQRIIREREAKIAALEEENAQLRAEKQALQEKVTYLQLYIKNSVDTAMEQVEEFDAIITRQQSQIEELMQAQSKPQPEQAQEEQELPQEIIKKLKGWPDKRILRSGEDRLENPEEFINRIFGEYYQGGYDPSIHPKLKVADLRNKGKKHKGINQKLYSSLFTHKNRHDLTSECIATKSEIIDQEIAAVEGQDFGQLPFNKSLSLRQAKARRARKTKLRSSSVDVSN
jgi:hypothetical protein